MKIGIDISQVVYETGVSNYTRNLINALLKIDRRDEFVLFGGSLRRRKELHSFMSAFEGTNVVGKIWPISPTFASFVWNNLHLLPIDLFTGPLDVFHSSDWTQPPTRAFKVTTIHDLVPLRFPNISHPKIVAAHKRRLEWVRKEVDKIVAVSEFTKKEIIELLNIEPERIVVIHEAADPSITHVSGNKTRTALGKYGVKGEYILVIGGDLRKNIPAIIQAFELLNSNLSLVIVGRPWEKIPATHGIVLLGHVPREDMAALYSGAKMLCFTSLYEGFGLPILEAMQAGCPVVTSNISSMPEVAGDAGVLVNPEDVDGIKRGIETALKEREELIKKGYARVKHFSWEKAAEATLQVYKEVSQ